MFREVLHSSILCIILKVGDDLDHCISTASNEFLADPTKARFEERVPCPSVVSAADVVNEALRLFPPTKCVYRKVPWPEKGIRRLWLLTLKLVIGFLPFGAMTPGSSGYLAEARFAPRFATDSCLFVAARSFVRPSRTSDLGWWVS